MNIRKSFTAAWNIFKGMGYVQTSFVWNRQYKKGKWQHLHDNYESVRYSLLAMQINKWQPKSILDVGCGEGILYASIKNLKKIDYQGIDISKEAISRIKKTENNGNFYQRNASTYIPKKKFDLIIFNESIYYLEYPLQQLKRYFKYLTPQGKVLISMYMNTIHAKRIWWEIKLRYKKTIEIDIRIHKHHWKIIALEP